MHFDQHKLVVQALQLAEEAIDKCEGVIVGLLLHINRNKPSFEVLSKERSPLRDSPIDGGLDDCDLDIKGIRDLGEEIQKLAN